LNEVFGIITANEPIITETNNDKEETNNSGETPE
jgi:hypothetical protein